jgi:hypothetical protein
MAATVPLSVTVSPSPPTIIVVVAAAEAHFPLEGMWRRGLWLRSEEREFLKAGRGAQRLVLQCVSRVRFV